MCDRGGLYALAGQGLGALCAQVRHPASPPLLAPALSLTCLFPLPVLMEGRCVPPPGTSREQVPRAWGCLVGWDKGKQSFLWSRASGFTSHTFVPLQRAGVRLGMSRLKHSELFILSFCVTVSLWTCCPCLKTFLSSSPNVCVTYTWGHFCEVNHQVAQDKAESMTWSSRCSPEANPRARSPWFWKLLPNSGSKTNNEVQGLPCRIRLSLL